MKSGQTAKRIFLVCFIICLNVVIALLIMKTRNGENQVFDSGIAFAQDHGEKKEPAGGEHGSEGKKPKEEKHGEEAKKGSDSEGKKDADAKKGSEGGGHGSSEGGHGSEKKEAKSGGKEGEKGGHGESGGGHGSDKKEGGKEGEKGAAQTGDEEKPKKPSVESKFTLNSLEDKRIQLQKQEELLKAEQEKMKRMKLELDEKINQLQKTHTLIDESLAKFEKKKSEKELQKKEADEKRMKQLVKMYSTMKPKQAGEIFNKMDIVIAEKIMMSMKGDIAGKILAYVESSKAAQISERLAMTMGRNATNGP